MQRENYDCNIQGCWDLLGYMKKITPKNSYGPYGYMIIYNWDCTSNISDPSRHIGPQNDFSSNCNTGSEGAVDCQGGRDDFYSLGVVKDS